MADVIDVPIVPEGTVTAIVNAGAFLVRALTEEFGEIQVQMTSTDAVAVGDVILVIPLPGGKVVGAVTDLVGLGDFANTEKCERIG